jgi:hypothetical protein
MPDAVLINPVAAVTYDCVNNAQSNTTITYDLAMMLQILILIWMV